MPTGKLKMWNAERGYGFIGDDAGGPDIFLHISALESAGIDPDKIKKGDRLTRGRTLRGDAAVQFDVKVALVGLIETRTLQQVRQIGRPDSIGGDNATMRKRRKRAKKRRGTSLVE